MRRFKSQLTMMEYLEKWLEKHRQNISPTTYEGYYYIIYSGFKPYFKNTLLKQVTPLLV